MVLLEKLPLEIDHAIEYLQAEKEGIKEGVFNQNRYKSKSEFYKIYSLYNAIFKFEITNAVRIFLTIHYLQNSMNYSLI